MRQFILGTDWWTDCDDAVALRLLGNAVKKGEIKLLGVGINACMEASVASLDGFLQQDGIEDIPIGIDLDAVDYGGNPPYQARLAEFAKRYTSNEQAENAVSLYRRLIAESKEPVEIIEIGYLQVIASFLLSEPDEISPKSGMELMKEKVKKVWVMAGKWDEDGGMENNFIRNERSRLAASFFVRMCPVPITFLGFEVGDTVITGGNLPETDFLKMVLHDHGSHNGRSSWDPMTVLLALAGEEEKAGYKTVCGTAFVDAATGANHFEPHEDGLHRYVVKLWDDEVYQNMINHAIEKRNEAC